MKTVLDLNRRGHLSAEQVAIAAGYAKQPDAFRLPASAREILDAVILSEAGVAAVEKRFGWAQRSGKIVLSVLLNGLAERPTPGSYPDAHKDYSAEDMVEWLTAGDHSEVVQVMERFAMTRAEARLFLILRRAKGRVLHRGTLLDRLFADRIDDASCEKTIDAYVCRLRKKLAGSEWQIRTVWGEGYVLEQTDAPPK